MGKAADFGLIIGAPMGSCKITWRGEDRDLLFQKMQPWLRYTAMDHGIFLLRDRSISYRSYLSLLQFNSMKIWITMHGKSMGESVASLAHERSITTSEEMRLQNHGLELSGHHGAYPDRVFMLGWWRLTDFQREIGL